MITREELQAAIKECEGERKPNANTCLKLASFYTIQDRLYPSSPNYEPAPEPTYSYAPAPQDAPVVEYASDTEFGRLVEGKDVEKILSIIDELMTAISVISPRLYDVTMQKIADL